MALAVVLLLILPTVLFFGAVLYFEMHRKRGSSQVLPQGNMMSWPLIGDTLSFLKPHPTNIVGPFIQDQISRYGRIFSCNLFGKRTIVSTDAEFTRFILNSDPNLFQPGYPAVFTKLLGNFSFIRVSGDVHRQMRSNVISFLSSERIRSVFLHDAEQVAAFLISSWKDGSIISAVEEAAKFSFYVIGMNTLGMAPGGSEMEKLRKNYETIVCGLGSLPVYLPGTVYWKALQGRKKIMEALNRKMEERKPNKQNGGSIIEKDDFLDWLMRSTNYSDEQIGDILLQTLFGGHDTTLRALSSMIYFLEGCPKARKQLREEHLQVAESKKHGVTWDDYKNMEFTQCVIDETFRLGGITTHLMRKSIKGTHFKGYETPRGISVLTHLKAMHLDPSKFEEPNYFNPWRWMGLAGKTAKKNLMPFGGGVRKCPGEELAKLEMTVFLHHLILNYDWKIVEPKHPMNAPFAEFHKGLQIKIQALST